MFALARTLRSAVVSRDLAVSQRDAARAEAATERRRRQRAEAHAVALAERLDELTLANQSYDKGASA